MRRHPGKNMFKAILLLALLSSSSAAFAASFNCGKARSKVERLICADAKLSKLDNTLQEAYEQLGASMSGDRNKRLLTAQQKWLRLTRNRCADETCLTTAYQTRINDLDPFADKTITCDEMRMYPERVFGGGIDLGSGSSSPIEVDYRCKESLATLPDFREFMNLAETIRSDGGPQICVGSIGSAHWRYYHFELAMAGFAPQLLRREDANEDRWRVTTEYFLQWSEQSFYNKNRYLSFMTEYEKTVNKLALRFETTNGLLASKAREAAEQAARIVLARAAGSSPSNDFFPPSKLLTLVRNLQSTPGDVKRFLADTAIYPSDILEGLRAALLDHRPIEFIQLLSDQLSPAAFGELDTGEPILAFAIHDREALQFLIGKGARLNWENDFGKTALFYAVEANQHETVKTLLDSGADVNHRYKSAKELRGEGDMANECMFPNLKHTGRTPLMHAAQHSDEKMILLLLHYGGNLAATDDVGFNVLNYAVLGNKTQNVMLLRSLGLLPEAAR